MSPPPRPSRMWVAFTLLIALAGIAVGAVLTRAKLRQEAMPCAEPGGCPLGQQAECSEVLGSAWSMWLDQPLSLWATAFYVLVAVLAVLVLRHPRTLAGCAPHLLLALAIVDVLVSLVMGTYSLAHLGAVCPFCVMLYAISLALLLCSAVLYRSVRPADATSWRAAWRRPGARLDAFFLASMIFVSAAGVQAVAGQWWRLSADPHTDCPIISVIPRTDLVFGAANPDVLLVAVLDPSCKTCKRKFTDLTLLSNDLKLGDTQLRVILFPRHACDESAFPTGFHATSDEARKDDACFAALAVECVEQLRPGQGANLLTFLYAQLLYEAPSPRFNFTAIGAAVRDAGIDLAVDTADNPLLTCINGPDATARVTAYQRWVLEDLWDDVPEHKRTVPILMLFPVHDGFPNLRGAQFIPADASPAALVQLVGAMRTQTPSGA